MKLGAGMADRQGPVCNRRNRRNPRRTHGPGGNRVEMPIAAPVTPNAAYPNIL